MTTRTGLVVEPKGAIGSELYIVELADAPLATYRGGVEGLAPTSPAVTGETKLNAKSSASESYMAYLADQRAKAISRASDALSDATIPPIASPVPACQNRRAVGWTTKNWGT